MELSKDLVAASAVPLILTILSEAPSYGYAIIRRIRDLSSGEMEWSEGMLYPVLHRVAGQGWIEPYWQVSDRGRRRRYYRLTPKGRTELTRQREQWDVVRRTLDRAGRGEG